MGKGKTAAQCSHAVQKTIRDKQKHFLWKSKLIKVYKVTSEN